MLLAGLIVACQAPAPPTPTPAPPIPTPSPPPPVTASRVETLNAAGAAFSGGDYTAAAGLYERAANTPPAAGEPSVVTDFADFRAMVALLADGR